ncbi:MAG: S8 family serine peptidase [Anaerovoracaceae bacterium]|nr:S8 family serine peptidase [Bacillota bacterium]
MKLFKKIFVIAVTVAMTSSASITYGFAGNASSSEAMQTDYSQEQLKDVDLGIEQEEIYDEDSEVTVIVELKEDSDKKGESPSSAAYKEKQQDKVRKEIGKKVLGGKTPKALYNYTSVGNGFAIDVKYGKLAQIQEIDSVKTAYVAPDLQLDPDARTNTDVAGLVSNATGYEGQGMVIAVIDSGIALEHPAFAEAVDKPALTKDMVAEKLDTLQAKQNSPYITADQLYRSEKIPFAFNYADKSTLVSASNGDHGTHVTGIAAGMTDESSGVAPQAQVLAMKVFSNYGSSGWEAIYAALDDAVALDADVINMSLGTACGFSSPESDAAIAEALDKVREKGILVAVAAGNEYNSAYGSKISRDRPLASNPDYGSMDSPASLTDVLAVASVESSGEMEYSYFTAGERKIAFQDTAETSSAPYGSTTFKSLGTAAVSYVPVSNHGKAASYEGIDMTGKIALVERGGGMTFDDMRREAKAAGAAALVVYNNTPGMLYLSFTDYDFPAAFISQKDGQYLKELENKNLNISMDTASMTSPTAGEMSDFSAWGVTPELKLKPDITAPGGNVRSAVGTGTYDTKSGTSMATPFVTGALAVVKQYMNSRYPDASADVVEKMLMSTAAPVQTQEGLFYSPRKQGAGSVNIDRAMKSPVYLTDIDGGLPKLELGDDAEKTGTYTLRFKINNLSDQDQEYILGGSVQTDAVERNTDNGWDVLQTSGLPYDLSAQIEDKEVTAEAGSTKEVTAKVKLDVKDKAYLDDNFPNGAFVEGFVTLTPKDTHSGIPEISLPYVAFYGDWTQAAIIDRGYYWDDINGDKNLASQYTNTAATLSDKPGQTIEKITTLLGDNPYHDDIKYLSDRNAISPNGDGTMDKLDIVHTGLLRSVKSLTYTVASADDASDIYYTKTIDWKGKSVYSSDKDEIVPAGADAASQMDPWAGTDEKKNTLPNNSKAMVTVSGVLAYGDGDMDNNEKASWSFPVTVDTEKPAAEYTVKKEDGRTYVELQVSDNQYVSNVMLTHAVNKKAPAALQQAVAEQAAGKATRIVCDVTGYGEKLNLIVNDYAGNSYEAVVSVPGNTDDYEIIIPTTPFDEDFEGGEFPPLGWTIKSEKSEEYTWSIGKQLGKDNKVARVKAYHDGEDDPSNYQDEWLISPAVNLRAEKDGAAELTFDFDTSYYYAVTAKYHNLKVAAKSDDEEEWQQLWSLSDWTDGDWWPDLGKAKIDIPAELQYSKAVRFAFIYEGWDGANLDLDNIKLSISDSEPKPEPPYPLTYTVTFEANGGEGTMPPAEDIAGEYVLPECGFTPPEGKIFAGWALEADGAVLSSPYVVDDETVLYAVWKDDQREPEPVEPGGDNTGDNTGGDTDQDNTDASGSGGDRPDTDSSKDKNTAGGSQNTSPKTADESGEMIYISLLIGILALSGTIFAARQRSAAPKRSKRD